MYLQINFAKQPFFICKHFKTPIKWRKINFLIKKPLAIALQVVNKFLINEPQFNKQR